MIDNASSSLGSRGVDITFLDCTLRDGGYYNDWDFPLDVIQDYLVAMQGAGVDAVEIGMRSLRNEGFKGACAYTTDDFLRSLTIPDGLIVGVMVNASELVRAEPPLVEALQQLFPEPASTSPVRLVRVACHVHEFTQALPAARWLKERGFMVCFNLMQVADRTREEVSALAAEATKWPLDALYFADSMGGLTPDQTARMIGWLRTCWKGPIGIHAHDNMGLALQNTLRALDEGAAWVDATVTGMGRGPGNAKTEYLALEVGQRRGAICNLAPQMALIRRFFQPMQRAHGWGTNAYYYLAGKHGIHPSYIQRMLSDCRYSEEDLLSVIEYLKTEGGKSFNLDTLEVARHFYPGEPKGTWDPRDLFQDRDVLIVGAGRGASEHRPALESFVRRTKPLVMALNTQKGISEELIDIRAACHPVRLLADVEEHVRLPQPLVTPASMLREDVRRALEGKRLLDFGLKISPSGFEYSRFFAQIPSSLVIAYALAVATCGKAHRIFLAGFDGYGVGDPRTQEVEGIFNTYQTSAGAVPLASLTPTQYDLSKKSVYGPQ